MESFIESCLYVFKYIIDMGAAVMLPIIIGIISLCIGVKPVKAIRAAILIGVGFIGMGIIVDLMNQNIGPAAQSMAERLGVSLSIVEVGWPGMSGVTWGSIVAMAAIPVAIIVNLIMFFTRLTKVINIDIWNVWHMAFTGAIVLVVTDNFWFAVIGVVIHAAISYKLGDLWAPIIQDYFGLDSLTVPHGTSAYMAPISCVTEFIFERIPGVKNIKFSVKGIREKVGAMGEPVIIGAILGLGIGLLAGYDISGALPLGIKMAAVMVLMPMMIKCIMNGILPISDRAKYLMQKYSKKSKGRKFYIGLDPAILLGDSDVITAGILFIPITLALAIIIPGNRVLPFGDLATIGFFIALTVGIHKGNLFRTLISGTIIMAVTIVFTNHSVEWTSELGRQVGVIGEGDYLAALDQGGCPITYIVAEFFELNELPFLIPITIVYGGSFVFAYIISKQRQKEIDKANAPKIDPKEQEKNRYETLKA